VVSKTEKLSKFVLYYVTKITYFKPTKYWGRKSLAKLLFPCLIAGAASAGTELSGCHSGGIAKGVAPAA